MYMFLLQGLPADMFRHDQECPRAYVCLQQHAKGKTSADDIQAWMKGRVARHKQLSGGISFVEEVPKSASGKILYLPLDFTT